MSDQKIMRDYWHKAGAGDKVNWHIAHIDDEEEFFASGIKDVNKIFDNRIDTIKGGSTVLDIGCGKGRLARALAEVRPDVRIYGVDVAPSMIQSAMKVNSDIVNLSFCVGDGLSLSVFPNEVFDVVYSYIVFQHLPRHITAQYIADAARVLKPKGRLIFQVQGNEQAMAIDPPWDNFRKIRYYTEEQAKALVPASLSIVRTRGKGEHDFFIEAIKS
ncbi:class I SAM-dependent methyltransferase [Agrobacterium sp. rho-13.3]|uniref:class I SAM-dependent methyltransferase n=1 Tax=Agrobacterium sp. rho-13.3 TaxID=3072980 RepID=UPI002A112427|nr:class I SAM-dependent methyltransferase [Agrobacterium sp. rho-13.3]MDX8311747.1 class I SAM-dependent methyltransferase [Agrobacterium sp. rho-13.3]